MDKKKEVTLEYRAGAGSMRVLSKKHGVSSTAIFNWIQSYEASEGTRPQWPRTRTRSIAASEGSSPVTFPAQVQQADMEGLPEDVATLRKQLAEERLRTKLLNAIIDVAEEELKVPIRKKPGTKR